MANKSRNLKASVEPSAGDAAKADALLGVWRVTWMENWSQSAFDRCGPAFFKFDDSGTGDFRFIVVTGVMDCRYGEDSGAPHVKFKWSGHDDCDLARGAGWARVEPDGSLKGHIEFRDGDDSDFTAIRMRDGRDPLKLRP